MVATAVAFSLVLAGSAQAASLDSSFGHGGKVVTATRAKTKAPKTGDYTGGVGDMAVDKKGRIVVGGSAGPRLLFLRYLPSGKIDPHFGDHGRVVVDAYGVSSFPDFVYSKVTAMAVQPDGKILAFGAQYLLQTGTQTNAVFYEVAVRLNADGSIDPTFLGEEDGWGYGSSLLPAAITLLSGGDFLVSGRRAMSSSGSPKFEAVVEKHSSDGSPMKSFGGQGDGQAAFPNRKSPHGGIVATKRVHGGYLSGGYFGQQFVLMRLDKRGKLDRKFGDRNTPGMALVSAKGDCQCAVASSMEVDKRGRIVIGGWAFPGQKEQKYIALVRFLANGHLDKSFGSDGVLLHEVNPWVAPRDIAIQPNGRILVAVTKNFPDRSSLGLYRFRSNGRIDREFFRQGRFIQKLGQQTAPSKIALDQKGRALVGGGTATKRAGHILIDRVRL